MDTTMFILATSSIFILYILLKISRKRNLPNGPHGVPFFGNMFQLDQRFPHQTLTTWAKEFGDIYLIKILGQDRIVLSGEEFIREAIVTNSEAFAGRPRFVRFLNIFYKDGFSMGFSDYNDMWIKVKKAVMTSLKPHQDGLKRIEGLTVDATTDMMATCKSYNGQPFDPEDLTKGTFIRIIFSLIYGKVISNREAWIQSEQHKRLNAMVVTGGRGSELEVLPCLRHIQGAYTQEMEDIFLKISSFHKTTIAENKVEGVQEDLVIHALLKLAREEDNFNEHDVLVTAMDLLFAGFVTSSSALLSFIALGITNPNIITKVQMEIDEVIGSDLPQIGHRNSMPYVNATILELLRLISHVPISVTRMTTGEVSIGGYNLPKGQEVWLNLWSLHHDDRYWDQPYAFKPERFLTPEGRLVPAGHINRRRMMAFGAGRRVCVGETMAKTRLFLIICMLYQRFNILPEDENNLPLSDPRLYKDKFVLGPDSYKIRCIPRGMTFLKYT